MSATNRGSEGDAMMRLTIEEWKAASGYDDLLAAHSAALTERDALRAEVERLRRLCGSEADDAAHYEARERERRITAAAKSLHRAWKRERDLVERYQRDHDEWMWNTDTCDCAICDEVRDRKSFRSDMRDGLLTRLSAFVSSLRADGLDIDDPDTAPTWTGKIHAPDGALLFDLATARAEPAPTPYSALCHHQDRPHCAGCPDDATCEASGREPKGTP